MADRYRVSRKLAYRQAEPAELWDNRDNRRVASGMEIMDALMIADALNGKPKKEVK